MYGRIPWEEIAWEGVNEHVSRKMIVGDRMMMVLYRMGPQMVWPEEIHEAEQGGYILKGKIELRLPAEAKILLLGPGDGYLIPSRLPHSWRTLSEETVLVDFFSPPRKELIENKFAPLRTGKD